MTSRVAALAVLLCVVLAGCSAPVSLPSPEEVAGSDRPTDADAVDVTPSTDAVPSSTDRGTADGATTGAAGTPVADRENPYGEGPLTVAVDAGNVSVDRDVRPLVREALAYWEANAERYVGYPVDYRLLDAGADPADADVVVRFVSDIADCGRDRHVAGCAPYVTRGPVDRPVTVRVRTGYADDSTVRVLEHELGHTLGLDHGDDPQSVMASRTALQTRPRTDAADREFAWNDSTLSVYVDFGAVAPGDREATERQVAAALDYYGDGADGTVPEAVTFERVSDPARADVTVRFSETSPCGAAPGSCGRVGGFDPDGDGALETYTELTITLAQLDTEAVAWHVARWLGLGLGLEGEEYPDPLRSSTSYEDRRSEWWD